MKTKTINNVKIIKMATPKEISKVVSQLFIDEIKTNKKAAFILATGSSPVGIYSNLIKDHQDNKTDWSEVTTFNLDEYVGLEPTHKQSYRKFMNEELFNKININKDNTHVPNGIGNPQENAKLYEESISNQDNFDICLLGVGVNGHIAFNEPGTKFDGQTSVVPLTESTIETNYKKYFNNIDEVPKTAISMGIGTILKNSNQIVMIAFGETKQEAINKLLAGKETEDWPITALLKHANVLIYTDCEIE